MKPAVRSPGCVQNPRPTPGRDGEGDPRPSRPERWGTVPIIAKPLHERFCSWSYQTLDAQRIDLAFCAGCGMFVRVVGP